MDDFSFILEAAEGAAAAGAADPGHGQIRRRRFKVQERLDLKIHHLRSLEGARYLKHKTPAFRRRQQKVLVALPFERFEIAGKIVLLGQQCAYRRLAEGRRIELQIFRP